MMPQEWLIGIGGLVLAVLALMGFGRRERRAGRQEVQSEAMEADHEKADAIRDRVERDLPDRVRDFDDAGYRDGDGDRG
ncbi:MAG: hypothetical protein KDK24_21740 [Pseudooceanicola sp.]|nr:hypothetical protein [Pseudooceanicola sp.]